MEVPLTTGTQPDAQPDTLNNGGKGALHDACVKGDLNAIKLLINAGADVDVKSTNNSTPLLLAAEYGHQSCVEELISYGADPTKRDNDGDSLVHVASLGGGLETLKFVLDLEGMSKLISSKNNVGQIPLHSAAKVGNIDCVELLLAQDTRQEDGEDSCFLVDEQDSQGKTPLHLAVEGGFSPVIEALIEAGADLNIQNNDGKTCLHLLVTLWGSPEHPDKKVQTTNGFEPVVSRYPQYEPLTDKGAICTTFDASGDTPIHCTNTRRLWQLVVSR
ncbi:serine/threonine-protein phosphatase 6 regulatory ankyrin repeat subunit A-like [Strongylocentrotus purpuratus]|uniref:Uncharacterized protein n=1 Tax=Strongylocentrotus purpuratus TaxID=7668 RepID=A0A7M7PEX0_STRPU|nr:serine/threonine-protein phosphatase 6 regulatory ankyrin repeat subunit A-like [Strongylocentrotus purpuratus]